MKRIVYLGTKPIKGDNVAATGLIWKRGEVLEVEDDKKAQKLLEHPDIWGDADQPYELAKDPEPASLVVPTEAVFVAPVGAFHMEVSDEMLKALQSGDLQVQFMTTDELTAYHVWKREQAADQQKRRKVA